MKIISILETPISSGGGFSQSLNAIIQMQRLSSDNVKFDVITTNKENTEYLDNLSIKSKFVKVGLFDNIFSVLSSSLLGSQIISKLGVVGRLEKKLIKEGCDLVYFVNPSIHAVSLQKTNYIMTVWDLCHRDDVEFPEVHFDGVFRAREWLYNNILPLAFIIIVDSEILARKMVVRYGVDRDRIISMPFSPSPFVDNINKKNSLNINMPNIGSGYFFYPAQFWPHKNHIRVLQALTILNGQQKEYQAVFVGGDQGNMKYIEAKIKEYNLEGQVKLLGFVSAEDIEILYKKCLAVVMPSYFGPTNLPPLEAWLLGKPLIYSSHLAEQAGNAAILVNPDSAEELADAMNKMLDQSIVNKYVERGYSRLNEIAKDREKSENRFVSMLNNFHKRRECWTD